MVTHTHKTEILQNKKRKQKKRYSYILPTPTQHKKS